VTAFLRLLRPRPSLLERRPNYGIISVAGGERGGRALQMPPPHTLLLDLLSFAALTLTQTFGRVRSGKQTPETRAMSVCCQGKY
jgi:hypothetical protein